MSRYRASQKFLLSRQISRTSFFIISAPDDFEFFSFSLQDSISFFENGQFRMTSGVTPVILAYVKSDQVEQSVDNPEKYRLFTEDKLKLFIFKEFGRFGSLFQKIMLEEKCVIYSRISH